MAASKQKKTRPEASASKTTGGSPQGASKPEQTDDPADRLLPTPYLLASESQEDYLAFRSDILEELEPRGALEHFWASEVVELAWEVQRYRRLRAELILALCHEGIALLLPGENPNTADLTIRYRHAVLGLHDGGLQDLLKKHGVTQGQIEAATLAARLPDVDAIRMMEEAAEQRLQRAMKDFFATRSRSATATQKPKRQEPVEAPQ